MKALSSIAKMSHRKFLALAMTTGIVASGTLVWSASNAAFSGITANPSNSWHTGSVTLTDDDTGGVNDETGTAMFALGASQLQPGATGERCIRVTYAGSVNSTGVKLYAPTVDIVNAGGNATGLAQYLTMKIEEGTGTGQFSDGLNAAPTCNFVADAGVSTLYNDVLGGAGKMLDSAVAANGNQDFAHGLYNTTTQWAPTTAGGTKVYRFTYTLSSSTPDTMQNKTVGVKFKWQTAS
jgi:hypothetical protein